MRAKQEAPVRLNYCLGICCLSIALGCATSRQLRRPTSENTTTTSSNINKPDSATATAQTEVATRPSDANSAAVRVASHTEQEPETLPSPQLKPVDLTGVDANYPIDLVTALRL